MIFVEESLREYFGYSLVVCGHSVGGSVAVLITRELLRSDEFNILPPGVAVRCVALAPAPVYRIIGEISELHPDNININDRSGSSTCRKRTPRTWRRSWRSTRQWCRIISTQHTEKTLTKLNEKYYSVIYFCIYRIKYNTRYVPSLLFVDFLIFGKSSELLI